MAELVDRRVHRVLLASFAAFTASADFALLKVGSVLDGYFPKSLMDYFDGEYRGRFAYGTLNRESIPWRVWWSKHFGAIPGVLDSQSVHPGFYLFHFAQLVAYHPGQNREERDEPWVFLLKAAGGLYADYHLGTNVTGDVISTELEKGMQSALGFLEGTVQSLARIPRPQATDSKADQGKQVPKPSDTPKARTPYEVLGLSPAASNDEVKKVYREQVARNHPDKVQHMSEDFHHLAEQNTKAITSAFEAIKRERGGLDSGAKGDVAQPAPQPASTPGSAPEATSVPDAAGPTHVKKSAATTRRRAQAPKDEGGAGAAAKQLPASGAPRRRKKTE